MLLVQAGAAARSEQHTTSLLQSVTNLRSMPGVACLMPDHVLHTLADLPADSPMPLIDRRRILGERMMISEVVLHPGFEVASHSHENEQMVVMLEGRAEFTIGAESGAEGQKVVVQAGQVLVLPPNLPHACRALERCRILDLFSPVSEKTGVDAHG